MASNPIGALEIPRFIILFENYSLILHVQCNWEFDFRFVMGPNKRQMGSICSVQSLPTGSLMLKCLSIAVSVV